VKFFGNQPAGLNADSEGVIRMFYDGIKAKQESRIREVIQTIVELCMIELWGDVDDDITFDFKDLWQLDEAGKSAIQKTRADQRAVDIEAGVILPDEGRQGLARDPDSQYAGLDLDKPLPEPDPMELMGEGGEEVESGAPLKGAGGEGAPAERGQTPHPAGMKPNRRDIAPGITSKAGNFGGAASGGFSTNARDIAMDALAAIAEIGVDEWRESDHPRGQPENKGQFGPGGGRGGSGSAKGKFESGSPATALFESETDHNATVESIMARQPPEVHAKIAEVRHKLSEGTPTDALVKNGGHFQENGTYTPERELLHREIVSKMLSPEAIERATPEPGQRPTFTILGGRGGSGKTWLTGEHGPADASRSIVINNDDIKEMLPEYEGWNAALVHEEATHLFNLVDSTARAMGLNVVQDATMKTPTNAAAFTRAYKDAGYRVEGYYMFLPPEVATQRALDRFAHRGRFVPPEYVMGSRQNEKSFDSLRDQFDKWAVFNNNVPRGEAPRPVAESAAAEAHDAANKISMVEAHYTDDGIGRLRCRFCSMFRPPDACTLVEGDVHPEGVCDHFDHK